MIQDVAVIIPSLNSRLINTVVRTVLSQQRQGLQLCVVVVGKDEGGLIPASPQVQFIDTGQAVTPPAARNIGVAETTADLLLFLDSDCVPAENWLAEHLAAHAAGHSVVSGSVLPAGDDFWQLTYNLSLLHEFLSHHSPGPRSFLATLNLSVERAVLDQVGPMPEDMPRGEDVEWTARVGQAGRELYFWPAAAVRHEHNRHTFRAVWRDCVLSGYYMRDVRVRRPDLFSGSTMLRHGQLLLAAAPFIATFVTGRIALHNRALVRRFWYTLPAIYATKIAWCWGASRKQPPV